MHCFTDGCSLCFSISYLCLGGATYYQVESIFNDMSNDHAAIKERLESDQKERTRRLGATDLPVRPRREETADAARIFEGTGQILGDE